MTENQEKIVALYVRVSTGYQVDKDSLPFQKKELKAYCEHVLHIDKKRIEIFEDAGKSGKNTKRPAFERMMNKIKAGQVSHVIVYKIDRISRNLVDFSLMYDDFKYNNVTFISLNEQFDTSSAIGEAILKIILVFAELERKLTSERKKPAEEVIYIKDAFPPIVDPKIWDAVNKKMDENAALRNTSGLHTIRNRCNVFAGLIVCGKCGHNYQVKGKDSRKGNGFRPSSYACTGKSQKNNCDNMNISDVNIGPFIINYIAAMVDASKKRKNIRNIDDLEQLILSHINFSDVIGISEESLRNTMDLFSAQTSSLGISSLSTQDQDGSVISQKNKLEEELQKTNRALERLKKAFLFDDDGISEKEFLEMKSKLEIDRIQIENSLKKISQDSISANVNHIEFIKTASQFLMIHEINSGNFVDYKKLASADEKTMKDFISSVVSGITVLDKRIVKIVFRNGLSHTLLYR